MSRSVHEIMTELLVFSSRKHPSVPVFSSLPICKSLLYSWSSQMSTEKRLVKLKHQKISDLRRILISSFTKYLPQTFGFSSQVHVLALGIAGHHVHLLTALPVQTPGNHPAAEHSSAGSRGFCPAQQHRHHTSSSHHSCWMEKSKDTGIPCQLLSPWG